MSDDDIMARFTAGVDEAVKKGCGMGRRTSRRLGPHTDVVGETICGGEVRFTVHNATGAIHCTKCGQSSRLGPNIMPNYREQLPPMEPLIDTEENWV